MDWYHGGHGWRHNGHGTWWHPQQGYLVGQTPPPPQQLPAWHHHGQGWHHDGQGTWWHPHHGYRVGFSLFKDIGSDIGTVMDAPINVAEHAFQHHPQAPTTEYWQDPYHHRHWEHEHEQERRRLEEHRRWEHEHRPPPPRPAPPAF
jgi:hypothetical protein